VASDPCRTNSSCPTVLVVTGPRVAQRQLTRGRYDHPDPKIKVARTLQEGTSAGQPHPQGSYQRIQRSCNAHATPGPISTTTTGSRSCSLTARPRALRSARPGRAYDRTPGFAWAAAPARDRPDGRRGRTEHPWRPAGFTRPPNVPACSPTGRARPHRTPAVTGARSRRLPRPRLREFGAHRDRRASAHRGAPSR
jgi:hypothetical protein